MKPLRIVVLQFANTLRVDLRDVLESERDGIARFAGECLAADSPPSLPLIAGHSCIVPADRVSVLLNGIGLEAPAIVEPTRHPLPIVAVVNAVRRYQSIMQASPDDEDSALAKANLKTFFDHYQIPIMFDDDQDAIKKAWMNG